MYFAKISFDATLPVINGLKCLFRNFSISLEFSSIVNSGNGISLIPQYACELVFVFSSYINPFLYPLVVIYSSKFSLNPSVHLHHNLYLAFMSNQDDFSWFIDNFWK
jgi:hypothetical protein